MAGVDELFSVGGIREEPNPPKIEEGKEKRASLTPLPPV